MTEFIATKSIRLDGGTQPRAEMNNDVVTEYAAAMKAGDKFPPIEVVYDGTDYWPWDGHHRVRAAQIANLTKIEANVRSGTHRDAILLSCGANPHHGLPRTNADKRRAVMRLLTDDEWGKWSSREIARRCAVSHTFIDELRSSLATVASENYQRDYINKHGKQSTMQTGGIGKPAASSTVVRYERDEHSQDLPDGVASIVYLDTGLPAKFTFNAKGNPLIYGDSFYAVDNISKRVIVEPFPTKDAAWAKYRNLQPTSGTAFRDSARLQTYAYLSAEQYAEETFVDSVIESSAANSLPDPQVIEPVDPSEADTVIDEPPIADDDTQKLDLPPATPAQLPLDDDGSVDPEQLPFDAPLPPGLDPLGEDEEIGPFGRRKKIVAKPESAISPATAEAIDTATSLRELADRLSNSGEDTPLSRWEANRVLGIVPAPAEPPAPQPVVKLDLVKLLPPMLAASAKTVLTGVDSTDIENPRGRMLLGFGGPHDHDTMLALQKMTGTLLTQFSRRERRFEQAILIAPAWTSDVWFGNLWSEPICFCRVPGRLPTLTGEMADPEALAVIYFGDNVPGFFEEFDQHGPCVISNRMMRRYEVDLADIFGEAMFEAVRE